MLIIPVYIGMNSQIVPIYNDSETGEVNEVNTIVNGKCQVWSAKLKNTENKPIVYNLLAATPLNE